MELQPELWRLVKAFVFDYRSFWSKKRVQSVRQLCNHPHDAPPRSWWDLPCSRISPHGLVYSRGFAYDYGFVYYPKGLRGIVVPPCEIVVISEEG